MCHRLGLDTSAAFLGREIRHHHILHGDVCVQRRALPDRTQTLSAWGLCHVRADRLHLGTADTVVGKEKLAKLTNVSSGTSHYSSAFTN